MAQWSTKRYEMEQKEKADQVAKHRVAILAERAEIFKKFRADGWEVNVVEPASGQFNCLPDNYPNLGYHFRVKMPGADSMRIKTLEQLQILVKGVS